MKRSAVSDLPNKQAKRVHGKTDSGVFKVIPDLPKQAKRVHDKPDINLFKAIPDVLRAGIMKYLAPMQWHTQMAIVNKQFSSLPTQCWQTTQEFKFDHKWRLSPHEKISECVVVSTTPTYIIAKFPINYKTPREITYNCITKAKRTHFYVSANDSNPIEWDTCEIINETERLWKLRFTKNSLEFYNINNLLVHSTVHVTAAHDRRLIKLYKMLNAKKIQSLVFKNSLMESYRLEDIICKSPVKCLQFTLCKNLPDVGKLCSPTTILEKVVFDGMTHIHRYAQQCRLLKIMARSPKMKSFTLKSNTSNHICNVFDCTKSDKRGFKQCGRCHSVYYCSTECQTNDWSEHMSLCKITNTKLPKRFLIYVCTAFSYMPLLQELILTHTLNGLLSIHLEYIIKSCPCIKSLTLEAFLNVNDATLEKTSLLKLNALNVARCEKISDVGVSFIIKYHCDTLTSLNLSQCHNVTYDAILDIVMKCKKLKKLNVATILWRRKKIHTPMPDKCAQSVVSILETRKNNTLKEFAFLDGCVSDETKLRFSALEIELLCYKKIS
jgi:hypothetical protein